MKKELKEQVIAAIKANIAQTPNFYIVDIAGLNAEQTASLRRECFNEGIKLTVVKNTLLHKVITPTWRRRSWSGDQSMAVISSWETSIQVMAYTELLPPMRLLQIGSQLQSSTKTMLWCLSRQSGERTAK